MTDIPNTKYITVKRDDKGQIGIFVGGKPAETYLGIRIYNVDNVKKYFAWMQEQNPNITEFHIGAFETIGNFMKTGKPSGKCGRNAWCRVVSGDIIPSSWVFSYTYSTADFCAYYFAYNCAYNVRSNASFRSAVLGAVIDKQNTKTAIQPEKKSQNPELKKLEQVDFAKLPKSPIELNGYKIIVEKIAETQQNKR